MKLASLHGRAAVLAAGGAIDVATVPGSPFTSDPQSISRDWAAFRLWADALDGELAIPFDEEALCCPAPEPSQVFALGLNYRDHAAEAGLPIPDDLVVFTKFQSSIAGPFDVVSMPPGPTQVDWEVELVVVMGREAEDVTVAGAPQYSLSKSLRKFSPFGPVLATPDEFPDHKWSSPCPKPSPGSRSPWCSDPAT